MNTNEALAKSDSKQATTVAVCEKRQEVICELHDLQTIYGPPWHTEGVDTQLSETLAMFTSSRRQTKR